MATWNAAWKVIKSAGKKIPWDKVIEVAPIILEKASELWDKNQKRKAESGTPKVDAKEQVTLILSRVKQLEDNELAQAELVEKITEQLNSVTDSMKIVASRQYILILTTGCLCIVAVMALILSLMK